MSQTFPIDGSSPYALTYHGHDQKVTLYALADADGIKLRDLVQVEYDGSLLTASKTLTVVAGDLVWRGAVIGITSHGAFRKPAEAVVKAGDLLEIQVGGLVEDVVFPTNTVTSAATNLLGLTTSTPFFDSASGSTNRYASAKCWAFVNTNTSATKKDLVFFGRYNIAS